MQKYHLRRKEKAISDPQLLEEIIQKQFYFTLAICKDDEPYLVSMNYAYAPDQKSFYFHSALEGKKIDYLTSNPKVWGQIVEDRGYLEGECDHNYRSVQFSGQCLFLEDMEEKRAALRLMINNLEENPKPVKKRLIEKKPMTGVKIGKILVQKMTGKEYKVKEA